MHAFRLQWYRLVLDHQPRVACEEGQCSLQHFSSLRYMQALSNLFDPELLAGVVGTSRSLEAGRLFLLVPSYACAWVALMGPPTK